MLGLIFVFFCILCINFLAYLTFSVENLFHSSAFDCMVRTLSKITYFISVGDHTLLIQQ